MAKGDYGFYCVKCKEFIRINSYTDYRPDFSPQNSIVENLRCPACGDVTSYTVDRVVFRDDA